MSFTNCENMTAYATNEYALNTSLSKLQKGNYTLYKYITSTDKLPLSKSNLMISILYLMNMSFKNCENMTTYAA